MLLPYSTRKNDKTIFVPLILTIHQICEEGFYHISQRRGYTNIWVDFKGKGFDNKNTKFRVEFLEKTKRPPSDFLGVFDYGDFAPFKGILPPPDVSLK